MDFREILKRAAAGEQLSVSPEPLSDEEREEMKRQRQLAMDAAMQAGPTMGTISKFGGIRNALGKLKEAPKPLKEFSYENPNFKDTVSGDDAVRQMTKMNMERQTPSLPSKEISAEELEQIMKLFGGK